MKDVEKVLRLPAKDLVSEIEKVSDTSVLDLIEDAEHDRENERKGAGRTTVFHALAERRKELRKESEDRRAPDQDAAIEAAFVAGTLPEEDRRAPEAETSVEGPLVEAADEATQEAVNEAVAEREPVFLNDELNAVRDRGDGVKVDKNGNILI